VMSCQTQVDRAMAALGPFLEQFPTPQAAATAGQAALVTAWGRLGYPRRARDLHAAACQIVASGWPTELDSLPGVGPWVAAAVAAQVDDADTLACDVNVRRVGQRYLGVASADRHLADELRTRLAPLRGRDLLLALVDLGAGCCTRVDPSCARCPLQSSCASTGPLAGEAVPARQSRFAGSLRQRRGQVIGDLRRGATLVEQLPPDALASLVADDLVVVSDGYARLR
jgi:A/G-specific adenine glycosylase